MSALRLYRIGKWHGAWWVYVRDPTGRYVFNGDSFRVLSVGPFESAGTAYAAVLRRWIDLEIHRLAP